MPQGKRSVSLSKFIGGGLGKPCMHARMLAGWAKVFLSVYSKSDSLSPKIVLIASLTELTNDVVSEHLLVC